MAPEHAAVFEELRERAFRSGAASVGVGTLYFGVSRQARFYMTIEASGWDRTFYGLTLPEVFHSVGVFLDERGFA